MSTKTIKDTTEKLKSALKAFALYREEMEERARNHNYLMPAHPEDEASNTLLQPFATDKGICYCKWNRTIGFHTHISVDRSSISDEGQWWSLPAEHFREQLQEAIRTEDYERAAQIHKLIQMIQPDH